MSDVLFEKMPPAPQKSPAFICAENIALLQFLHDVPTQPSNRSLLETATSDGQLPLSLEHERQLTGILATLSSIREDVALITAVAIRQFNTPGKHHPTSLEVLVAVNKSKPSDGEDYLGSLEYRAFVDIVSICKERILSRLRFGKHKRGKTKAALKKLLHDMCDAVASHSSSSHGHKRAFMDGTRRLIAAFNQFEKHQTDAELLLLVEEIDTWTRMGDLFDVFRGVPSSALNGACCEDYRRIFNKIGQYRTAARRLYRLTRKVDALRGITIKPVHLGPSAFIRPDTTGYVPSLVDTLSRLSAKKTKKGLAATLCNCMGKATLSAEHDFMQNTLRILAESRIHAEVQILVYLKNLPPNELSTTRVIQSMKKACFLCNEILALNRSPSVPKSHGRLYSGWRLPALPGLKHLQLQLNESLQRHACKSIERVLQKKQMMALVHPIESTALTVSEVTVTEAETLNAAETSSEPGALAQGQGRKIMLDPAEDDATDASSALSEAGLVTMAMTTSPRDTPSSISQDDTNSRQDQQPSFYLCPGDTSLIHKFGESEMSIEYAVAPDHPKSGIPLVYHIRQLDEKNVGTLKSQQTCFFDVMSLDKGSEATLPGNSPFYINMNDIVVELTFHGRDT
ncbi:predicted protein [Verticillium alfalfae VaMs.102]|uniref:Predicted protein n=1 Tax=Verticillium alfalfae (strain VaMs.102 / ATCC MYA-4576 / FGSC 10136) TaxID=526221 RepID=C9SW67_VERA1|nr:predicted protein [Verticillium alfalfae VaMs.102]EEY23032.1 predicted protein [Verticillium alfalfae VaMs.102]